MKAWNIPIFCMQNIDIDYDLAHMTHRSLLIIMSGVDQLKQRVQHTGVNLKSSGR